MVCSVHVSITNRAFVFVLYTLLLFQDSAIYCEISWVSFAKAWGHNRHCEVNKNFGSSHQYFKKV
jgi:hypothetical protein